MEKGKTRTRNRCIWNGSTFDLGTGGEQERQGKSCEEFDANEPRRTRSTSKDSSLLATRFRIPTKTDAMVKLRAANDDALPSNRDTKVTPTIAYEKPHKNPRVCRKDSRHEQHMVVGERKQESSLKPLPKLELFNPREEEFNAWQLGESADAFVQRLPPSTTSIYTCGSIWAENPHRNPRNKLPCPRVHYFKTCGKRLLKQSLDNVRKLWESSATLSQGILAKKLIQEGKSLQEEIVKLARDTYVHSGKWILFIEPEDVDRVWKQIVAGVIENQLGCSCKVITNDGNDERLVCVYTKDFQDTNDVLRVLQELESMGLVSADKTIYYESDACTYLNLEYGNAAKYALVTAIPL